MNSQKVLLDVIRPIEQFVADVAMKRLVFLVNILMSIVEIASVGGVGAALTGISVMKI